MVEQRLYSPEVFDRYQTSFTAQRGETIRTISINRNNRFTDIYAKIQISHLVRPTVYRGYFNEDGSLAYDSIAYPNLQPNLGIENIVFSWNPLYDQNYVNYFIVFECLRTATTELIINEIGVQFDRFDSTLGNKKGYSTLLVVDINKEPLSKQRYDAVQEFSILTNRTELEPILNVLDKPFYLIDVISDCLDNSTKKMALDNPPQIKYITSATQDIQLTIRGTVQV